MEQLQNIQYNPTQVNSGFNPLKPVDYTNALATEHERQLRAERAILEQMRRNEGIEQANDRQKIEGVRAIAEFSKTAAEELGNLYVEDAVRQRKEAFTKELLNPSEVSPDYVEGKKQAESEFVVSQKVAGEIGKVDYEAATPFRNESVWAQMGRTEAQALMAIESELPQIISEATKQFSVLPPNEREEVINKVVADFAESKGLTGMRRSFLEEKILPTIRNVKKADSRQYRIAWGKREAAQQLFDLERRLKGSTPDTIIPELAAIAGEDGYPMGFPAAWEMFQTMVANNVISEAISHEEYTNMRNAVIPEGNPGAGKTYGEFYPMRFKAIDQAIDEGEIKAFKLDNAKDEMLAQIDAQEKVDALLADGEGFTDDTLNLMIKKQEQEHGFRGVDLLEKLRTRTLEYVDDQEQEIKIKSLRREGALTENMLRSMGVSGKLFDKYIEEARRSDKALAEGGGIQFIKALVEKGGEAGRHSIAATPDGSRHFTVGRAEDELTRFYKKALASILEADPEKSTAEAQKEARKATLEEYRDNSDYKVTKNGYPAFNPLNDGDVDTSNVRADIAQREMIEKAVLGVDNYLDQGVADLEDAAAFQRSELDKILKTYGTPNFVIPEKAKTIGRLLNMDPFRVIAKQLAANNMPDLPDSPAIKTFTDAYTPEQQRILNKNPTPANSIRVLGSAGEFKPEIVPLGLGPVIQEAATKYGIPPAILAGLLEAESGFLTSVISGKRRSSRGAIGVAQFLPGTAAEQGVDPLDTTSSIHGAARYLRNIMDGNGPGIKYQGRKVPLETAIYMYNAGPNYSDLSYYPYGNENTNYLPKVLKLAYKYGYKQALNDPSIVRPAFQ